MHRARAPRVSFATLGCKVNQYETRQLAESLLERGYRIVPFGQPADLCVVNTCTVTHDADAKSRQAIRRARRSGDDPLVVVTGCYADVAPEAVRAIGGIAAIVPNREKPHLPDLVDDLLDRSGRLLFPLAEEEPASPADAGLIPLLPTIDGTLARTRAVIKIQDGCNHFCSFCIIPFARGRLRSRPAAEVLAEARELAAQGYRELVLTGICLGDYGDERGFARTGRDPLAQLVESLAQVPGIARIRMSSLDPADISDDLLDTMRAVPAACRHLHLSIQSADPEVLRRMRRRYSAEDLRRLVDRIYERMPEAGLTADVIAGFPGESVAQFENTLRWCEEARLLKIHAFPYSPRTGTQAARWRDDVSPAEKQRRVRALLALSERLGYEFAARYVGETVVALLEQRDRQTGLMTGLTGEYLRVCCEAEEALRGELVRMRVTSAGSGWVTGERVGEGGSAGDVPDASPRAASRGEKKRASSP